MPKTTLGRMPRDAIRMLDIPRPSSNIIDAFKALVDLTGTISDACAGVIPAFQLPRLAGMLNSYYRAVA